MLLPWGVWAAGIGGLIEARNDKGELSGIERLAATVTRRLREGPEGERVAGCVLGAVNGFQGQSCRDDMLLTVISLR